MTEALAVKLDQAWRNAVPVALTLLLVLLASLPYAVPYFSMLCPLFAVISVYYWRLYRPDAMPLAAALAIGLLMDLLSGGPLGLMGLVLVLVGWAAESQRRALAEKPFIITWLGFASIALGAAIVVWVGASLFYGLLLHPGPQALQLAVTIAVYPAVSGLFSRTRRHVFGQA